MSFVDPISIHDPQAGVNAAGADWGDTVNDNLNFLASPPGVVLTRSPVSTGDGTPYQIEWDGEGHDPYGMHATGDDDIVLPIPGLWVVTAQGQWAADADGYRALTMQVNGAQETLARAESSDNSASVVATVSFAYLLLGAAGDVITFRSLHNAGGNLAFTARCSLLWISL